MVWPSLEKGNFIMKKRIAVAILAVIPAVAMAGPSVGLGYSDIGLSGHSGRPGVTLGAGNLYSNNVLASGSATVAHGYYEVSAEIGKLIPLIPADGLSFEPFLSLGFVNMNYNQRETGGLVSQTTNIPGGASFTQFTQQHYNQAQSIQDFYGLAGVNMNIPLSRKVTFGIGGGYGHTFMTYGNGNGGAVYTGDALAAFKIAPHITTDLQVSYLHLPAAPALVNYGAGLAYHF